MQVSELYKLYLKHPSIQTDSRKLKEDDLFFALKGPNFNGNLFANQAIAAGAAYAIVDEEIKEFNDKIIRVENVLNILQELAGYHRSQFTLSSDKKKVPFIAVTGSNGKTTSK